LNRAQQLRNAFFVGGPAPHLTYSLRTQLAPGSKQEILLTIDGQSNNFTAEHQLQHTFQWPAPSGAESKADGNFGVAGSEFGSGFSAHGGLWAVFRFFGDAARREPNAAVIEWKETRSGTGLLQPLKVPVQLEFAGGFPGGVDVFHPDFFKGFRCSFKPVQ
jgi:type VI protein secretion system component VasK